MQTVQERIIKVIYNKTQLYPSNELYRDTKLFDLRQLFCQSILVNQQKQKSCLKKIAHKYETRHKKYNIKTPISHKTIGQRGYTYLSPRIYNCIPMELKELNSINLFKNRIKKWIQDRPREYIHQLIDIKNFWYLLVTIVKLCYDLCYYCARLYRYTISYFFLFLLSFSVIWCVNKTTHKVSSVGTFCSPFTPCIYKICNNHFVRSFLWRINYNYCNYKLQIKLIYSYVIIVFDHIGTQLVIFFYFSCLFCNMMCK